MVEKKETVTYRYVELEDEPEPVDHAVKELLPALVDRSRKKEDVE
jgi:hypothetical protein